jgi:hypothetical protein
MGEMMGRIFIVTLFAVFSLMITGIAIPSSFATGMGVSMSAEIMPYDYADNPILELNGNIISWIPYSENSKFDIIKDGKEIIKDTAKTSYQIKSNGCYHIEDESHYRVLDSNTVCLNNGVFTVTYFKMNEPPIIIKENYDNSQYRMNFDPDNKLDSIDTLEIVVWATAEKLTQLNACNHIDATGCYDPNNHRIHISWETMESFWHEMQHAQGIEISNHNNNQILKN